MADTQVTITISAKDNFTTVMNKYDQAVKKAETSTKKMSTTNKGATQSFKDMGGVVQGVFGAAVLQQFGQAVGQLNEMGIEAGRADKVFRNLSKTIGGYDNAMARLRQTTDGVIDDTSLQLAANKLLLSGMAQTGDELNKIVNISTKLGAAMGKDATSAMEEFGLMLMNQSVRRLDTFGISASNVRLRMEGLKESGMDAEEAFKIATFEQADVAMTKLGDAANISATAWDKMGTRIDNAVSSLSVFVSTALEAGAQLAELLLFMEDVDRHAIVNQILTGALGSTVGNAAHGAGSAALDMNPLVLFQRYNDLVIGGASRLANPQSNATNTSQFFNDQVGTLQQMQRQAQIDRFNSGMGGIGRGIRGGLGNIDIHSLLQGVFDINVGNFQRDASNTLEYGRAHTGAGGVMDSQSLDSLKASVSFLEKKATTLSENPFIKDDQLDLIRSIVDETKEFADNAERARKAFDDMNLSELFGQTSGGTLGEITDTVVEKIADPERRAAARAALDQSSGRTTDTSIFFEDEASVVLAKIFDEFGVTMGTEAAERMDQAFKDARFAGLSPDETRELVLDALGFGLGAGDGGTLTIAPGDTPWGLSRTTGYSIEEIQATGDGRFIYPGTYNMGGGGALITRGTLPESDFEPDTRPVFETFQDEMNDLVLNQDNAWVPEGETILPIDQMQFELNGLILNENNAWSVTENIIPIEDLQRTLNDLELFGDEWVQTGTSLLPVAVLQQELNDLQVNEDGQWEQAVEAFAEELNTLQNSTIVIPVKLDVDDSGLFRVLGYDYNRRNGGNAPGVDSRTGVQGSG